MNLADGLRESLGAADETIAALRKRLEAAERRAKSYNIVRGCECETCVMLRDVLAALKEEK